jgi:hypothetical protein
MGHFGAKEFGHFGASGSGGFGHSGYRALSPGICNYEHFGYNYRHSERADDVDALPSWWHRRCCRLTAACRLKQCDTQQWDAADDAQTTVHERDDNREDVL